MTTVELSEELVAELEREAAQRDITIEAVIRGRLQDRVNISSLLDAAPNMMIGIYDLVTGNYIYLNRLGRHALGQDRDVFPLEETLAAVHPEDKPRLRQFVHERLPQMHLHDVRTIEFRLSDARGQWRWMLSKASIIEEDAAGQAQLALGVTVDITRLKRLQTALEQSYRQLRHAQEVAGLGYFSGEQPGGPIQWSERLFEITGRSFEEGPPTPEEYLQTYVHPEDRANLRQEIERAIEHESTYTADYRIIDREGELHYLRSRGEVTFDPVRGRHVMIGTVLDVTEYHQMEEEIRDQHRDLEQAVATQAVNLYETNEELRRLIAWKDEFFKNVSHELRTPIASLKVYHHMIGQRPDKHQRYIDILQAETNRLEMIVMGLLAFSELKEHTYRTDPVDVSAMVQKMAEEQEREITVELEDDLPPAAGDARMLHRAVGHLLTNAVQFTPADGTITVRTAFQEGDVVIEVADTGVGIPPEEHDAIFEAFFRGGFARSIRRSGAGLGLAAVQEIVAQHNGRVTLTSDVGQGSVFRLWLPAYSD